MPTKERAARERYRDALRDIAFEVAEHVALGDMATVERREHGAVKFSHSSSRTVICECGLPCAPFPHRLKRYGGWLPWWLCSVCHIKDIIHLLDKVDEAAELLSGESGNAR